MAYTSIHSIKATDGAALRYITNGDKTVNGLYVQSYACRADSRGAAEDFRAVRATGTGRTTILAHHLIQSFEPGEITPEQALQIGEELCDRLLQGDYQYVLAVHSDKDHIHCHIIFNNTNLYNGLSFTTEHNQGKVSERSWAKVRQISDEICKAHGLSVIEPKGKGVSYFEHAMQIQGKSWKDKLRAKIAEVAFYSKDFNDFLQKCSEYGIEYVYKPSNKVKLKFRLKDEGQQRFTRADTLGEEFTPERIAEQIEQIQKTLSAAHTVAERKPPEKPVVAPKTEQKQPQPQPVITTTEPAERKRLINDEFLAKLREKTATQAPQPTPTPTEPTKPKTEYVYQPPTEDELDRIFGISSTTTDEPETSNLSIMTEEEYIKILEEQDRQKQAEKEKSAEPPVDLWKEIRGMGRADEIIAELEKGGITSYRELSSFFFNTTHEDDHTDELDKLKKKYRAIDTLIEKMNHRDELESVYKEYKSKSGWAQSRFKKKNADKIEDYEQTVKYIKEHSKPYYVEGRPPTMLDLLELSNKLKSKRNGLIPEHTAFITKRDTARKYTAQVRQYMNEQHNKREREKSRQRKLDQQRKRNTLE